MENRLRKYLLIGSGRLAKHLGFYFSSLGVPLETWSRQESISLLPSLIVESDVVLLAISDSALNEWVERSDLNSKTVVHFAGAKYFKTAWGLHPLMTFSPHLYPAKFYAKIPMVADSGFPTHEIFPFLANPIYQIDPEKRPLYHALCNMAANFPALLWVQVLREFEQGLKLPADILKPLVQQALENTFAERGRALTGPLRRGDSKTLQLHATALKDLAPLASLNSKWNEWATSYPPPENHL